MAIDTIKFKRGVKSKLNNLSYGEPAYISDENELYIGTEDGVEKITRNKEVAELSSQLEHIPKKLKYNNLLLENKDFYSRHTNILNKINTKQQTIKGYVLGDSIGAGNGSSEYSKCWFYVLCKAIRDLVDTSLPASNFSPVVQAVGGQNIYNVIPNVGLLTDTTLTSFGGNSTPFKADYWCICTGRNDSNKKSVPIEDFEKLYRYSIQSALRHNIDVFCFTEPPKIDMSTGLIHSDEVDYPEYADVIRRITMEENVSIVDVHYYLLKKLETGEDIRKYYSDGVHLNDLGNQLMSDLCLKCIKTSSQSKSINKSSGKIVKTFITPQNSHNLSDIDGLGNTRVAMNNENKSIILNQGESISFDIGCIEAEYVFISGIMKASSGNFTVQCPEGLNALSNVSFGNVLNTNAQTTLVYKNTPYLYTSAKNTVKLTCNSGTQYITAITVIGSIKISEHEEVNATMNGNWSRNAIAPNMYAYKTNIAGDSIEIDWIGTELNIEFAYNPKGGDVEVITDDIHTDNLSIYMNGNGYLWRGIHSETVLNNGLHKTVLKAKTDSNGRTGVYLRGVRVFSSYNNNVDGIILNERVKGYITHPILYNTCGTLNGNVVTNNTKVLCELKR